MIVVLQWKRLHPFQEGCNLKNSKEPVVMPDPLTDKQRLFCVYYTKYCNASKAYEGALEQWGQKVIGI